MPLSDRVQYKDPKDIRREESAVFNSKSQTDGYLDIILERVAGIADKAPATVSNLEQRLAEKRAELEQRGGVAEFWGLFTHVGNRVAAKLVPTRWGLAWAICDKPAFVKPTLTLGGVSLKAGVPEKQEDEFLYFVPFCKAAVKLRRFNQSEAPSTLPLKERIKIRSRYRRSICQWEDKYQFSQLIETVPAVVSYRGHDLGKEGSLWVGYVRADEGYPKESIVMKRKPLPYDLERESDLHQVCGLTVRGD